jgi:HEAT repeat protein
LEVDQTYPQLDESFSQPIEETVQQILLGMGMRVTFAGGECEADLSITMRGDVFKKEYTVSAGDNVGSKIQCYSGASINGDLRLTSSEYGSLTYELKRAYSPNFVTYCAEEPSSNVEFNRAWPYPIVYHLTQIWGPQVSLQALKTGSSRVQEMAAEVLSGTDLGVDKEGSIPILIDALKDGSPGTRMHVAEVLGHMGPDAIESVPVLIEVLEGASVDSSLYFFEVATALGKITGLGYSDKASVYRRWWEIHSLLVTKEAEEAVPTLIEILKGGDSDERRFAAEALGSLGAEAADAIPVLIEALNDEDVDIRGASAKALGSIGPAAKDAVPILVQLLADEEWRVVQRADDALAGIGPAAIPALIEKAEENKDNYMRYTNHSHDALRTLYKIIGEEYEVGTWGTPAWTMTVENVITRSWEYYEQQGSP